MTEVTSRAPLELWAGFECTLNRVGDSQHDQLELTGHYGRLDDLDRLAELGVRTTRYPILWERIERPTTELIARGLEQARANSWESIVSRMERIIRDAMRTRESRTERPLAERVRTESRPETRPVVRTRAALAGAGEDIGE